MRISDWSSDVCSSDLHCFGCDGEDFVDTNCLAVFREAFHLLPRWALMPEWAHAVGDRMMWLVLRSSGLKRAHAPEFTVCYRDSYISHYVNLGDEPPAGATSNDELLKHVQRWDRDGMSPI